MIERAPNNSGHPSHLHVRVLKNFSGRHSFRLQAEIEIGAGITILFGRSGAGKSTLLNCIAGITHPDEGRVTLGIGDDLRVLFDSQIRANLPASKRRIGYIFQNLALFPHLPVRQNVEYGITHLLPAERSRRSQAMLELFHVERLVSHFPDEISGGERQRVALARTLVTEPAALLLDEPLSALDVTTKNRILEDFQQWNAARNLPVLYVTHNRREALRLGQRTVLLENGVVAADGDSHDVLKAELDAEE